MGTAPIRQRTYVIRRECSPFMAPFRMASLGGAYLYENECHRKDRVGDEIV